MQINQVMTKYKARFRKICVKINAEQGLNSAVAPNYICLRYVIVMLLLFFSYECSSSCFVCIFFNSLLAIRITIDAIS
jgi:hypothetical protein